MTQLPDLDSDSYRGGERAPFLPFGKCKLDLDLVAFRYADGTKSKTGEKSFFATFVIRTTDREDIVTGAQYCMRFVYDPTPNGTPKMQKLVAFLAAVEGTKSTDPEFHATKTAGQLCQLTNEEKLAASPIPLSTIGVESPYKDKRTGEQKLATNYEWTERLAA